MYAYEVNRRITLVVGAKDPFQIELFGFSDIKNNVIKIVFIIAWVKIPLTSNSALSINYMLV